MTEHAIAFDADTEQVFVFDVDAFVASDDCADVTTVTLEDASSSIVLVDEGAPGPAGPAGVAGAPGPAGAPGTSNAPSPFVFGVDSTGFNGTRYMVPGYWDTIAPLTPEGIRAPRAGTLKDLRINKRVAGAGASETFAVRVNGVLTALAVTVAASSTSGSNTTDFVSINAGDLVEIQIIKSSPLAIQCRGATATVDLE
jgi:hypothetical protein